MSSLNVPAQTDSEYSAISSNQCSWCAAEFALQSHALIKAWATKKPSEFLELYKSCMLKASQKRKELGTFLYGENIDSENLLYHYTKQLNILHKNTILLHEDPTFVEILHKDLASEFYQRKYPQNESIDHIMNRMPLSSYLLVSRHGQSLCILRISPHHYLILDSHLHIATLALKEETQKHILMDNGGHTHVTLLFGI